MGLLHGSEGGMVDILIGYLGLNGLLRGTELENWKISKLKNYLGPKDLIHVLVEKFLSEKFKDLS